MRRREFLATIAGGAAFALTGGVLSADENRAGLQPAKGGNAMSKQIDDLRWRPRWVSHLGCVKGCLEYLGSDISWAWLYGGTGHAFVINIHEVVCPSGPTAWHYTSLLLDLAPNLGYQLTGLYGEKKNPDFAAKQEQAWEMVRESLDKGLPCYGWELDIPEWYVIYGYDDVGYFYSGAGCDGGKGPKPWQGIGTSDIGLFEMYSVQPTSPAPPDKVVKDAFALVLKHAESPEEWIYPKYRSGPAGFDLWAEALEQGTADRFGQGYNGAVWAECRAEAVWFLAEARNRLPGKADALFIEAISHYSNVAARLRKLSELYPFEFEGGGDEQIKDPQAAELVREAGEAERRGLEVLGRIVEAL